MIADASPPSPALLCRNCKHCKPGKKLDGTPNLALAECTRSEIVTDYVTGDTRFRYCETMRSCTDDAACGPAGKFFQLI